MDSSDHDAVSTRLVARAMCGAVGIGLLVLLGSTWLISYSYDSNFHYQAWEVAGSDMIWLADDPTSWQSFWGATFPLLGVIFGALTLIAVALAPTLGAMVAAVVGSVTAFFAAVSFNAINFNVDNVSVTGAGWSIGFVGLVGIVTSVMLLRSRPRYVRD